MNAYLAKMGKPRPLSAKQLRAIIAKLKDAAECQQRDGLDRMEWIKRTASQALGEKPQPQDPFCTNCFRSVFDCQCPRPIVSR